MPIKIDEHAARGDGSLTRYIEGVARQQRIAFPAQTSEIAMLMVFFEAGSDRAHTHEHDQTLLILTGECMVATETEKYVLSDARHRSRHRPPPQRSGRRSSLSQKKQATFTTLSGTQDT